MTHVTEPSAVVSSAGTEPEIDREQGYVSMLYARLDAMRELAARRLVATRRQGGGGTHQARSERDSLTTMYLDQVARLGAVEHGLCFGRLDFVDEAGSVDGARSYIGRLGIFDDSDGHEPLLLDWRAPEARAFYLATAASPEGVRRRRHIRTRLRTVIGLDDEVLELSAAADTRHPGLTGEATLLAAVGASRTGRMKDIVETIQAEQDHIIRAPMDGLMVVQGGPGTGKTAVALHRAAYLLYTYRQQLSTRAVLIVGPNDTFLRYISQVLPSLAETGVVLCTVGDLFPGVTARRAEPAEVAEIKGRPVMAEVIAAAVADRERLPAEPVEVSIDRYTLWLPSESIRVARQAARDSGRPHNAARPVFDAAIVEALADQLAKRIGSDPLGGENLLDPNDRDALRRELRREHEVRAVLDWLWPVLRPEQVVAALFASDQRLAAAAPQLSDDERRLLRREPRGGWSPADVPLLDEAAELLGERDSRIRTVAVQRSARERMEYAAGALEVLHGSRSHDLEDEDDPEILMANDLLDAMRLGERQEERESLTAAERAAGDREWAYGHVIVDEAQELSAMAWRLLMRRSPSRSMTLVGDVAQTGDLAGTSSWAQALAPYVADRWRLTELTVNYRTPAEIMAIAAGVLSRVDPALVPPRSVRSTGVPPRVLRVAPAALEGCLAEVVAAEVAAVGDGRVGVIVPAGRLDAFAAAVGVPAGGGADPADRVVVLSIGQAKGLEFDAVVVAEPGEIVHASSRGYSDLYVALTRATQRLAVVHAGDLPAGLSVSTRT